MKIKIAVSIKMHLMIRVGGYILLLHIYIESDFVVKCSWFQVLLQATPTIRVIVVLKLERTKTRKN